MRERQKPAPASSLPAPWQAAVLGRSGEGLGRPRLGKPGSMEERGPGPPRDGGTGRVGGPFGGVASAGPGGGRVKRRTAEQGLG